MSVDKAIATVPKGTKKIRVISIADVENGFVVEVSYKLPAKKGKSSTEPVYEDEWEHSHRKYVFMDEEDVKTFVTKLLNL